MLVEIWSDIVCPWCFIGKRRFERALERFAERDRVEVIWRAFELDPEAERDPGTSVVDVLAAKYGGGREQAEAMMAHVTAEAATEGLSYRLDIARRGNSFDAHRLAHLAREVGLQGRFVERVMLAYLSEGAPIGDRDTLVRLAGEAGLPADRAEAVLTGDAFAEAVRADERLARRIGVNGVPCFVFDRATGCAGAQPPEVLGRYLQDAWDRRGAPPAAGDG